MQIDQESFCFFVLKVVLFLELFYQSNVIPGRGQTKMAQLHAPVCGTIMITYTKRK